MVSYIPDFEFYMMGNGKATLTIFIQKRATSIMNGRREPNQLSESRL